MRSETDLRKYWLILAIFLVITNIAIIIDMPIYRQILGFIFLTIVPGWLILHILGLHQIEFFKRVVLSLGLSIAFLMFSGLLINSLYISKPLSLLPLLLGLNIMLLILAFFAYWRCRSEPAIKSVFNIQSDLKGKLLFPLLLPILFPFLSIFGTYLMNTQENNLILLVMLGVMPAYVIVVVCLRNKIAVSTFPIAIWMIGIALLLMLGLTSNHMVSYADPHKQYYVFKLTANNSYWSMSHAPCAYNAMLSITILPAIYHSLLNVNPEYIFKLVFQLIFSITPVITYLLFKKYVGEVYAFLSSFFFMAQIPFIWYMPAQPRVEIAIFFFALAMLVVFDDEILAGAKRFLFLTFAFSIAVSHYATTYIFLFLVIGSWLGALINKKFTQDFCKPSIPSFTSVTALVCFTFLWHAQITSVPFVGTVNFFENFVKNILLIPVQELRGATALKTVGVGLEEVSQYISMAIHNITFLFITVGVLKLLQRREGWGGNKFEEQYVWMMILGESLLIAQVLLPYIAIGYDTIRLYLTLLTFMSPAFIIGGEVIIKGLIRWTRNPILKTRFTLGIIIVVLLSQFLAATSLVYLIFGNPELTGKALSVDSKDRRSFYIYEQEVASACWLKNFGTPNSVVQADFTADSRFIASDWTIDTFRVQLFTEEMYKNKLKYPLLKKYMPPSIQAEGTTYAYLRWQNVIDNMATVDDIAGTIDFGGISSSLLSMSKVYDNGFSAIYYRTIPTKQAKVN